MDSAIHVHASIGFPEEYEPLENDVPDGWYGMGYPWKGIKNPEHYKR